MTRPADLSPVTQLFSKDADKERALVDKALGCLSQKEQELCRFLREQLFQKRNHWNKLQHPAPTLGEARAFVRCWSADESTRATALALLDDEYPPRRLPTKNEDGGVQLFGVESHLDALRRQIAEIEADIAEEQGTDCDGDVEEHE